MRPTRDEFQRIPKNSNQSRSDREDVHLSRCRDPVSPYINPRHVVLRSACTNFNTKERSFKALLLWLHVDMCRICLDHMCRICLVIFFIRNSQPTKESSNSRVLFSDAILILGQTGYVNFRWRYHPDARVHRPPYQERISTGASTELHSFKMFQSKYHPTHQPFFCLPPPLVMAEASLVSPTS